MFRGSRKHILDWTSIGDTAFIRSLNDLVHSTGAMVGTDDIWMPHGYEAPSEARLDRVGSEYLPKEIRKALANWWLVHKRGANTPNWDLTATCHINGNRGLVLIEAKANEAELKAEGKLNKGNGENHSQIKKAIEEAKHGLCPMVPGICLSRDHHYQLSNRVAFAWKLASLGIPTVLIYLGFIGDTGIDDVGPHFRDEAHWLRVEQSYMNGTLPEGFCGVGIDCGLAEMQMVIRSRPILRPSPKKIWNAYETDWKKKP